MQQTSYVPLSSLSVSPVDSPTMHHRLTRPAPIAVSQVSHSPCHLSCHLMCEVSSPHSVHPGCCAALFCCQHHRHSHVPLQSRNLDLAHSILLISLVIFMCAVSTPHHVYSGCCAPRQHLRFPHVPLQSRCRKSLSAFLTCLHGLAHAAG